MRFLLDHFAGQDLGQLWNVAGSLTKDSKEAIVYWEAIDNKVFEIIGEGQDKLNRYKIQAIETTKELGQEGIAFWEAKIEAYHQLSQEEAVEQLIKAEKIQAKIQTIKRAISIDLPL